MTDTRKKGKKWHIAVVMSITSGVNFHPRGMSAIHEFLDDMTGETLFTSALPMAARMVTPQLLEQFPELPRRENLPILQEWSDICREISKMAKIYGEFVKVRPYQTKEL